MGRKLKLRRRSLEHSRKVCRDVKRLLFDDVSAWFDHLVVFCTESVVFLKGDRCERMFHFVVTETTDTVHLAEARRNRKKRKRRI